MVSRIEGHGGWLWCFGRHRRRSVRRSGLPVQRMGLGDIGLQVSVRELRPSLQNQPRCSRVAAGFWFPFLNVKTMALTSTTIEGSRQMGPVPASRSGLVVYLCLLTAQTAGAVIILVNGVPVYRQMVGDFGNH